MIPVLIVFSAGVLVGASGFALGTFIWRRLNRPRPMPTWAKRA